jgi:hypothetical protein
LVIRHLAATPVRIVGSDAASAFTVAGLAVEALVLADIIDDAAAALLLVWNAGQAGVVAMVVSRTTVLAQFATQLAKATGLPLRNAEGAVAIAMLLRWANVQTATAEIHAAGRWLLVVNAGAAVLVATLIIRTIIETLVAAHLAEPGRGVANDAISAGRVA